MKILLLHCDYIRYRALKKALKEPEEISKETESGEIKEPLVILAAIEKQDESNNEVVASLIREINDIAKQVSTKNLVLYPYAHLSSSLSKPDFALKTLKETETQLRKQGFKVTRAPFGYYKEFELKVKGHPLSELSREINSDRKVEEIEEKVNHKQLLREISKSKLDSSKLKENDHRILGKQMDLFSFSETAPGMVFWHNKGLIIKKQLIEFWREEHEKAGYQEISTPQILDKKLWLISGHWEKFKDNMFTTEYEKRIFAVKPMNCPGGMLVYKNSPKSYKDLPLKVGELGIVHRQELSGVLSGLFRVIQFTQDDAHIFCLDEKSELLTQNGWKKMDEIKLGELAFSYNKEKNICELKPVKRLIKYNYEGEMYWFKNGDGLDCLVTPEHRVLCKIRTTSKNRKQGLSEWKFLRADKVPTGVYIPTPRKLETVSKCDINNDLLSILGWIITDGHQRKKGGYLEIEQATSNPSKPNLYKKMVETTKKLFPESKVYLKKKTKNHKESATFYLGLKATKEIRMWLDGEIHRIPRILLENSSSEQLEKLFEALVEGDGTTTKQSKNGHKQIRFYCGYNEGLANDFQELCTRLGISSTKVHVPQNNQFVILVSLKRDKHYSRKVIKEPYSGKVWDITIEGGAFVTRRNGKVFITGNCTEKQLEQELINVMELIDKFYKLFNFKYSVELSTRPEKRIGSDKIWDKAESTLEKVLKKKKLKFKINKKDGAFYGPKIDYHIKDSLGREWQMATLQLDFAMPERFELTYNNEKNKIQTPIMLHRVIYGAIERFIGILLEHYNGKLPLWLSPTQIRIINFTDRNNKACEKLKQEVDKLGFRADLDLSSEPLQGKIKQGEIEKIPYIIVIGDKEEKSGTLAVRNKGKIKVINTKEFIEQVKKEVEEKL